MKIMLELRLFFAKILASFQTDSLSKNSVPENGRSKAADTACQKSASATFFSPKTCTAAKLCTRLYAYLFPPFPTLIGLCSPLSAGFRLRPLAHPIGHCIQGILSVSSFLNPTLLYSINREGLPPFASSFRMFFSRLKTGVPKRPSERHRIFTHQNSPSPHGKRAAGFIFLWAAGQSLSAGRPWPQSAGNNGSSRSPG